MYWPRTRDRRLGFMMVEPPDFLMERIMPSYIAVVVARKERVGRRAELARLLRGEQEYPRRRAFRPERWHWPPEPSRIRRKPKVRRLRGLVRRARKITRLAQLSRSARARRVRRAKRSARHR